MQRFIHIMRMGQAAGFTGVSHGALLGSVVLSAQSRRCSSTRGRAIEIVSCEQMRSSDL